MSEEIKKGAQDVELNAEELDKVAGGYCETWTEYELEVAQFYVTGVCPRCGIKFASQSNDVLEHIKGWDSGQE